MNESFHGRTLSVVKYIHQSLIELIAGNFIKFQLRHYTYHKNPVCWLCNGEVGIL